MLMLGSPLLWNLASARAQILDDGVIESADAQTLQQEIDVFTTIQRGINLSVAECELFEACNANVNRGEIERLISTIDGRVNSLSLRYSETGDSSLEGVLVAYADVRDSYKTILEKIGTMAQFAQQQEIDAASEGDDFFTAGTGSNNSVPAELMQLFQDADEELVDDPVEDSASP